MNKVDVLGVLFDSITKKELCRRFSDMLDGEAACYVVTPNSEIVEFSVNDCEYRDILNRATLCIADGIGVIYASKLLGTPLPERVPGVEAGESLLCLLKHRKKESAFFLGAEKGVAEAAAERMSLKYKGLLISGTHHGYFNNEENEAVLRQINESGAEVLFVCMGHPRQEKWISDNLSKLKNIKIALALGGSIDVYAGKAERSPDIFIKMRLEWLWRAFCVKGHLKSLAVLPGFAFHSFEEMINKKNSNKGG